MYIQIDRLAQLIKVVTFLLFCTTPIFAQITTATISGVVKDEAGALVSGAGIKVKHLNTGLTRAVISDQEGRYRVSQIPIGNYELEVGTKGFQTQIISGVAVTVASEISVDITLKVGSFSEKVTVGGKPSSVELTNPAMSGLADERAIQELPLNGRSFDQLIALQTGTHLHKSRGISAIAGFGDTFNINGARFHSNRFTIDGTEYSGIGALTSNPGGVSGKNLGVDAISEFRVFTTNYGAEYGKRAGGQVNIVTKSGTNELHGTAFEYYRDESLDARNFFDPGPPPSFKRNNFGVSIGGPIKRNKTFIFGAYEGLRERQGLTLLAIVPDANARLGFLPLPGGGTVFVGIAANIRPYLDLYPVSNGRNFGDGTAEFQSSPIRTIRDDFFTIKLDHYRSEKNMMFASYRFYDGDLLDPHSIPGFARNTAESRQQMVTIGETTVFSPTFVNTIRFGFNRWAGLIDSGKPIISINPALKFAPWYERIGDVRIGAAGTAGSQGLTEITSALAPIRKIANNLFEIEDQLAFSRGRHSIKTGIQVQRILKNTDAPTARYGRFIFPSLETFLRGLPRTFEGPLSNPDASKAWRQTFFGVYFQDEFRLASNLALSLGLRYEFITSPKEKHGKSSNYIPTVRNGVRFIETIPPVLNPPYENNSLTGIAPRVGLAWDPLKNGKTSLRAGFGVYSDQHTDLFQFFLSDIAPFFDTRSIDNPPFPFAFSAPPSAALPRIRGIDPNIDVPTILRYNLQIQREIKQNTIISIGYVGANSFHLLRTVNPNTAIPIILSDGRKFFPPNAPRRNTSLGGGDFIVLSDANANYNSLQAEIVHRLSNGLRAQMAYTFSKSIDDASQVLPQETLGQSASPQDPDGRNEDRGLSAFDTRHNLVVNYVYDLPFGKGKKYMNRVIGLPGKLISGWQISGITALASGNPFTPLLGFNRARNGDSRNPDRPNLRPGVNPILGGPDRYFDPNAFTLQAPGFFGTAGRSILIGPGLVNFDFAITKDFLFTEKFKIRFGTDIFNVFNRANFGLPQNLVFNPDGTIRGAAGRIQETVTPSRQIQLSLKAMW